MIASAPDRRRLEEMVQFAAAYRGWTTKQLAEALHRDPRSLVPERGTPKIDLIVRLAGALDWPVADLLDHLSEPGPRGWSESTSAHRERAASSSSRHGGWSTDTADSDEPVDFGFESDLERLADVREFIETGDLDAAIELADEVGEASDPSLRAEAALLLATCLNRRGRPVRALNALQHAAALPGLQPAPQLSILARLADAYHRTGQPVEARALAADAIALLDRLHDGMRAEQRTREAAALAHAVRAACLRDAVLERAVPCAATAVAAREALDAASAELAGLHHAEAAGIQLVVDAGRMAVEVRIGERDVDAAMRETIARLDDALDPACCEDRGRLEGLGWWCVLAGAAAIGRLASDQLHRTLAILTNKADEIAAAVDCWALRERILMLEHDRRCRLAEFAGHAEPWLLDRDDLRIVIGCMGASQRFRPLGQRILRESIIVHQPERCT